MFLLLTFVLDLRSKSLEFFIKNKFEFNDIQIIFHILFKFALIYFILFYCD